MDFTTANPGLRIRKILPGRDNLAIADLIERSFREFLDPDGRAFIETLRKMARINWLDRLFPDIGGAEAEGFVCVNADGKPIAILHLLPIHPPEGGGYLIVNVCVDEGYRGRGIAVELLRKAIAHARNYAASALYLQVRSGNPSVVHLYESQGFEIVTVRTDWLKEKMDAENLAAVERLRTSCVEPEREERDEFTRSAARAVPPAFRWNIGWDDRVCCFSRPLRFLKRLAGYREEFWTVVDLNGDANGRKIGWIAFQPTGNYADRVWILPAEDSVEADRFALMGTALRRFRCGKPITVNMGAEDDCGCCRAFGFSDRRELIWMRLILTERD